MIYDVPTHKDYSDTYMFNELILKQFNFGFEYNDTIMEMLGRYIDSSKLVFLNSDNDYFIVNEKAGHWHMDCWFSNTSYKQVNNYVDYGGVKKYKSNVQSGKSWWSQSNYDYNDNYHNFAWDEPDTQLCNNCDMKLYGINELEKGKCSWCIDEEAMLTSEASKNTCDCCDRLVESAYSETYNAFICEGCRKEWDLGA